MNGLDRARVFACTLKHSLYKKSKAVQVGSDGLRAVIMTNSVFWIVTVQFRERPAFRRNISPPLEDRIVNRSGNEQEVSGKLRETRVEFWGGTRLTYS